MGELEFGIIERKGKPVVSSRYIAEVFEKNHQHIMETIRKIIEPDSGVSEKFNLSNFRLITYKDIRGRKQPEYEITKDGFALVTMGFSGKKAMKFKEAYINKFNEMESFIQSLISAKLEFPDFTNAIMEAHEEPKHYHFSNEINMINRIVLGMDAKRFKEVNGISKEVNSIRPYLSISQISSIEKLQKFDIGLITILPEYEERKQKLAEYHNKLQIKMLKGEN